MLIDTHCHLASSNLGDSVENLISRAIDAGVTSMITIGTDLEDSERNVALAEQYAEVYATVGIHPTSVHEISDPDYLAKLEEWVSHPKVVGIGEIGMDFYHPPRDGSSDEEWRQLQEKFFIEQLELAEKLSYPVVVHQRESFDAVSQLLAPFAGRVKCVIHCFTGTIDQANAFIDQGHLVSFTGVATFPKALEVQEAATNVPSGSFMVETDSPYLSPVPHRGKKCEPAFTAFTAQHIANLRGVTLEELASETSEAADEFFKF